MIESILCRFFSYIVVAFIVFVVVVVMFIIFCSTEVFIMMAILYSLVASSTSGLVGCLEQEDSLNSLS